MSPKPLNWLFFKPLIKKPQLDPKDLVNYRPISNLLYLSKMLEKVASSQLYSFLEKNYICEDSSQDLHHLIVLRPLSVNSIFVYLVIDTIY